MKNLILKYRDFIGSIILWSYLLIFTLNIFHFHNYDFDRISAVDLANESKLQVQVSGSGFECIIHQNFISLHTFTIPNSQSVNLSDRGHLFSKFRIIYTHINRINLSKNHLRAPPIFS